MKIEIKQKHIDEAEKERKKMGGWSVKGTFLKSRWKILLARFMKQESDAGTLTRPMRCYRCPIEIALEDFLGEGYKAKLSFGHIKIYRKNIYQNQVFRYYLEHSKDSLDLIRRFDQHEDVKPCTLELRD